MVSVVYLGYIECVYICIEFVVLVLLVSSLPWRFFSV